MDPLTQLTELLKDLLQGTVAYNFQDDPDKAFYYNVLDVSRLLEISFHNLYAAYGTLMVAMIVSDKEEKPCPILVIPDSVLYHAIRNFVTPVTYSFHDTIKLLDLENNKNSSEYPPDKTASWETF